MPLFPSSRRLVLRKHFYCSFYFVILSLFFKLADLTLLQLVCVLTHRKSPYNHLIWDFFVYVCIPYVNAVHIIFTLSVNRTLILLVDQLNSNFADIRKCGKSIASAKLNSNSA